MDRKIYLDMCQRCATIPDMAKAIREGLAEDLRVIYKEIEYYPKGYLLSFDLQGKPIHTAMLINLKTNYIMYGDLKDVKAYKEERGN